jgi:hypothetical protein
VPAPPTSQIELLIGQIDYDGIPEGYAFGTDDATEVAYGDFQMRNHFEKDGLTFAGSNTSPVPFGGSLISVIRVGAPRIIWVCEWTSCRMALEPQVPDPASQPPGWTLLDVHVTAAHVSMGPNGIDPVYRVSGVYVYVKGIAADDVFDDVTYAKAPWVREGAFSRRVSASRVRKDYMAGGGGAGAASAQGFSAGPSFANQG